MTYQFTADGLYVDDGEDSDLLPLDKVIYNYGDVHSPEYYEAAQQELESLRQEVIRLQKIKAYCESVLNSQYLLGVSSDHEAGHLAGQEAACHHVLDIINEEDE